MWHVWCTAFVSNLGSGPKFPSMWNLTKINYSIKCNANVSCQEFYDDNMNWKCQTKGQLLAHLTFFWTWSRHNTQDSFYQIVVFPETIAFWNMHCCMLWWKASHCRWRIHTHASNDAKYFSHNNIPCLKCNETTSFSSCIWCRSESLIATENRKVHRKNTREEWTRSSCPIKPLPYITGTHRYIHILPPLSPLEIENFVPLAIEM